MIVRSLILLASLLAFAAPGVYGASGTVSDQASCEALVPGASWSFSQCTIQPSSAASIGSGDQVTIAPGVRLVNFGALSNAGSIIVNGSFSNDGTFSNTGEIDNAGEFHNHNRATNRGTIRNFGSMGNSCIPAGICEFENQGAIENSGFLNVNCSVHPDQCTNVFYNRNYLRNTATGRINILWGGMFQNGGSFPIFTAGTLDNYGEISVTDEVLTSFNRLGNFGTINNYNYVFVSSLARLANVYRIYNFDTFEVRGFLHQAGEIYNACGADFDVSQLSGNPITNIPCPVDTTATTMSPGSATLSAFDPTGVTLTVTVSDTTTPALSAPTGTVTLDDGGAGGAFQSSGGDSLFPSACSPTGWEPLVPISTTASRCVVVYYPPSNVPGGTVITITAAYQGDGSHSASSVTSTVTVQQTPAQALQLMIGQVQQLEWLNAGQANSLASKLNNAIAKLSGGQNKAAANQLAAVVNELNALVKAGVLSQSEAIPLINQINAVIGAISP